jgi:integrase
MADPYGNPYSCRDDDDVIARNPSPRNVRDATLHRLRHNVATFLVSRGEILQAQARLGHADAATTLREYAYALPLTDQNAADAIDHHLDHLEPRPNAQDRSEI